MKGKAMRQFDSVSRRAVVQGGLAVGAGLMLGADLAFAAAPKDAPILRTIPSSGEKLPVIGIGTNQFGVADPEGIASRKGVLQQMPAEGGKVIDTARGYGTSEVVIGRLLKELGNRDKFFISTKTPLPGPNGDVSGGKAVLDVSFAQLQVDMIDLLNIHNFNGLDALMPHLLEYKQAKKIRYIGATTSIDSDHERLIDAMKKYKLDFIQVNYSIGDRESAQKVLPYARDNGVAVLNNVPFGGSRGSYFPKLAGKPLPDFAKDIGATTWAQFMLKYNLGNPAITAIIPGTTEVKYLADNQAGGRGVVPDAALRKRMEDYWATLAIT
jgi:aryl-alcohol dehydrogenase-like predicted oxidoreductase